MPVRSYTGDRLSGLLGFVKAARGWGGQGNDLAQRTFQEMLAQPDLAASNNCFILEEESEVQGFCLVTPELPIGRTVLEIEVAPQIAGSSPERDLLRRGIERARELGARVSHICPLDVDRWAALLAAEGFVHTRTYWDMVWDQEAIPQWQMPQGFAVRSFRPGDASLLAQVQIPPSMEVGGFAQILWSRSSTVRRWRTRLNRESCSCTTMRNLPVIVGPASPH
ncbi:MAG: hypothetical protein BZY88_08055 [SAR202 cluster bacterium Io17-Chloro-G9]|nr:MAG: hypothetical protein BZY88_08055 [SAR202 cluster bacterium Io17-Chloro-G9]